MRLVIKYDVGDDYTWWSTVTVPLEYESAEAFAVDFEAIVREQRRNAAVFYFAGAEWDPCYFLEVVDGDWVYTAPDILTVDEWFARGAA